jgi:hypothetical protein
MESVDLMNTPERLPPGQPLVGIHALAGRQMQELQIAIA